MAFRIFNKNPARYLPSSPLRVLFLFVIMLMNLNKPIAPLKNKWLQIVGVVSGGCLLLVLVAALRSTEISKNVVEVNTGDIGLIKNLGKELFTVP